MVISSNCDAGEEKKAPQKSLVTSKYCPFFFTIYSNFRHFFFLLLMFASWRTLFATLYPHAISKILYSRIRTPTYFWLGNKVRSVIMHSRPFLILCCERWHVRRCWIYGAQCFFSGVKNNWLRCIFSTLKAFSRLGKLNHTGHLSSVSSKTTSRFLHFLSKQLAAGSRNISSQRSNSNEPKSYRLTKLLSEIAFSIDFWLLLHDVKVDRLVSPKKRLNLSSLRDLWDLGIPNIWIGKLYWWDFVFYIAVFFPDKYQLCQVPWRRPLRAGSSSNAIK